MREQKATGVKSVGLALDVMEAVAFSGEEMGVTQIADRVGATKGSVHRHLCTMVERGYLSQNPATGRYGIGPKSRLLARLSSDSDLAQAAEGPMRDLRDQLGHTVVLSTMAPRGALVVATIAGTSSIEIGVRPGSELSFHASAQGKALLAFAAPDSQKRILALPRPKLTAQTITERDRLAAELAAVAKRGWADAPQEAMLGVNALAAPIFDRNEIAVAAVAIVGSIQFIPQTPARAAIAALKACAEQISRGLGSRRARSSQP